MAVHTAVVTVAGSASRMWPSSKAGPKELFPLGRVPALVHLVWEFEDAGIQRVIFVTSPRSDAPLAALLDPASPSPANVREIPEVARFEATLRRMEFLRIPQEGPYGNGTPLRCALPYLQGESIIFAFGDDIVFGENATLGVLDVHARSGLPVLATQEVAADRTRQFGIVEAVDVGGFMVSRRLVEKPAPGVTDSRLAVFGRYLVTPGVQDALLRTTVGKGGELWLTDAFLGYEAAGGRTAVFTLGAGRWVTVGDPRGYAEAVRLAVESQV